MSSLVTSPEIGHSRAVLRPVLPGSTAICAGCETAVKFASKVRRHQVIANVYVAGRWNRVEHYHPDCYSMSGDPHGEVRQSDPSGDRQPVAASRS